MGVRSLLALALAAAAGCVTAPDVPDPGEAQEPMPLYADVLLNYTENQMVQTCREGLPPCEEPLGEPCGPPEVLGEPDGVAYTFDFDGRIDVGFHCGAIVETAEDFQLTIHATVPEGKSADVFVSLDGLNYYFVGDLTPTQNRFDLTMWGIHSARYVRISDTSMGGIAIDAIEGTWNGTTE